MLILYIAAGAFIVGGGIVLISGFTAQKSKRY